MSKAIDYINVAIVGDFERGYYVNKDDAVKAVEIERKEMIDKALEWIKTNIRPYYSEVKYHYDDFIKAMEE